MTLRSTWTGGMFDATPRPSTLRPSVYSSIKIAPLITTAITRVAPNKWPAHSECVREASMTMALSTAHPQISPRTNVIPRLVARPGPPRLSNRGSDILPRIRAPEPSRDDCRTIDVEERVDLGERVNGTLRRLDARPIQAATNRIYFLVSSWAFLRQYHLALPGSGAFLCTSALTHQPAPSRQVKKLCRHSPGVGGGSSRPKCAAIAWLPAPRYVPSGRDSAPLLVAGRFLCGSERGLQHQYDRAGLPRCFEFSILASQNRQRKFVIPVRSVRSLPLGAKGKELQGVILLKNARLPPLGMAPACLQGLPPPPFNQRSRLLDRRRAEVRTLLTALF
jgi:hypothetical protein